jgi:capsular exopolysaccharide synthesis family protein
MTELVKTESPKLPAINQPRQQNIWIDQYLDEREGELTRYLHIILKRKWSVLSVALLVFAGVAAWTYASQRWYTSSVNIQIDPDQNVLPYKEAFGPVSADPRYLLTQAQVIKSEALARRVVVKLKFVAPDSPDVTAVARGFLSFINVSPMEGAQIVRVSYTATDPASAARSVDALADEYIEYGYEVRRDSVTTARNYLGGELVKLQTKLKDSEEQMVTYARQHNIPVLSDGGTALSVNAIGQKLAALNDEMTKVEAEMLSNQYQGLQDISLDSFPDTLKTDAIKNLDNKRAELEQKLATLTLQFGSKWPEVISLNRELTQVQQQLADEKQKALDRVRVGANLTKAHHERLAVALADQKSLADRLSTDSIGFNALKREWETDRQLHESLLQRLKEMDVAVGLKSDNVHIIDRARVPKLPSSPNVPLSLALGLTLSLVAGVFVGCAVEFFDRTVKTPEDVERELRMPFLAAIPSFDMSWRGKSDGVLVPLRSQPEREPGRVEINSEIYRESYRGLRTSLLFSAADHRPTKILVTSAVAGEGKTTTAVNLATSLAQTGALTVLLELDLRRPRLSRLFDVDHDRGISRFLAGHSELNTGVQETGIPNLFLIAAGPLPPNPPELLGSTRMTAALDLLSRHFEYVVIDSPPVMAITDTLVLSTLVDGVLLVVNAKTPTATAQMARNRLRSVDAQILGAVVNNVKGGPAHEYYQYSYGSPTITDASS